MASLTTPRVLQVRSLFGALIPYSRGLELQEALAEAVKRHLLPDQLLLLQHDKVYTRGKRGSEGDFHASPQQLRDWGIAVHDSPRGGETTYHGPGQLIAYPIVNLRAASLGARAYVERLEDTLIDTLGYYGIEAKGRIPGATGVWVGDRKIAAIGVRISNGVASHGIALNVSTDLSWFKHIIPCGAPDKGVTSVRDQVGGAETPEMVAPIFAKCFAARFGYDAFSPYMS
ncbi:hypothetical protein QBZ16_002331 [Prototheca wickerhamii]|uniref:lipoyl(octanoyl) transferase n=1 Tax=Prototheca wickerhamii TaxID=3111 RepID=A0AAD9MNZ3_PROWI|nr:hypothetical protein QBZ16_002331 [Prototheca wickerhamii]